MAWATQILSDKDFEVTVKATCTAAESEATILDASALDGHDSSPALDIIGAHWCTTGGTLLIEFDADTDDTALVLVGNGKLGGFDGLPVLAKNPKSTGSTGDIRATSAGATTLILRLRKSAGYDNLV
ncbi:MAG: hypothetical protein VW270_18380 [Candidatus Poseidoniales archaeon]